ncbi:PH domain-containing protein [Bacillus carboniphilus]|uniref:PH domain-containing protein n=1 Tax=Bacillus carboniphilus TaxID=86663 RepID=A0ABY9JTR5_9BACI|nr:PH domain-containing protein [Bacillus carboniphilus]WLR42143.1 PH domain-containing protein [Bacillus carboniphilus]
MSEAKRLHPIGVLYQIVKVIRESIFPILLLFITDVKEFLNGYLVLVIVIGILLIGLIGFLRWWKFTYRIENDEFRVEQGVFIKKQRYIPIERIHAINIKANLFNQMFKLVKLQIETAGGGFESEVDLTAISKEDAENIKSTIQKRKVQKEGQLEDESLGQDFEEQQVNKDFVYSLGNKELFIMATTSSGIGIIFSAFAGASQFFDNFLNVEELWNRFYGLSNVFEILLTVFVLFFLWALSVVGTFLKYANYQIEMDDEMIYISKGILEKQQLSVPLSRVQAITIEESLLRQPFGYGTVKMISAGSGSIENQDESSMLFPLIHKKNLKRSLAEIFPNYEADNETQKLPLISKRRYIFRSVAPFVILSLFFIIMFKGIGALSLLVLPLAWWFGVLRYKDAGWNIDRENHQLTLKYRRLVKSKVLMKKAKIQSYHYSQSFLQKRYLLTSVHTNCMSGAIGLHTSVRDVDRRSAEEIYQWLSRSQTLHTQEGTNQEATETTGEMSNNVDGWVNE